MSRSRLTDEDRAQLLSRYMSGEPVPQLALAFGVGKATIYANLERARDPRPVEPAPQQVRPPTATFEFTPQPWAGSSLCTSVDPEIFYPEKRSSAQAQRAKKICSRCEVRTACLEYALATGERYGIWGGTSERERRRLRGERARAGA